MIKQFYITIFFAIISTNLFSQNFESVDINKIKAEITDENSDYFYPKLFERYSENDTTLTLDEFRRLYYGHALQPYYNPNISRTDDSARTLKDLLRNRSNDFGRLNNLCKFVLRLDPFWIDALYILSISSEMLGDLETSEYAVYKHTMLLRTILQSGDGRSYQSAFTILSISDEYSLLNALGLKFKEQALMHNDGKPYDYLAVEPDDELEIEGLYFNIELFFGKGLSK
ncbi:MAG: DUF4919 domain-containing protein [Candidatus Kapabacteria bacterium]|nr:DUF4919 domain-containing protein [Ignavibacteriota bacterium]MCW5886332.1 DUF4919 domain-containing protein [Candidatus Kapabacteria bacterium]